MEWRGIANFGNSKVNEGLDYGDATVVLGNEKHHGNRMFRI